MASVSITSKSYEGRYFKFTVTQSGTSTTVNWTFEVLGGSSSYYSTSPINCYINGKNVCSLSATDWSTYAFPAAKGSKSGSYNIGSYGSFTIKLSGNPYWSAATEYSKTLTLTKPTYTVTYNANGGAGAPSSQTKTYGVTLTLSSTKPTRTGYTFKGWATSASSTTVSYAAGATYSSNAKLSLYAVWQANTYTVTYNANGGSGAPSSQTKTYGVTLTLSSVKPTRTNYIFKGWATSASSTTVSYAAGATYSSNAKLSLYAVWELAYVKPRITNIVVNRCTSDGTSSEDGTYAIVAFNWSTDKTISYIKIEWRLSTETTYSGSKTVTASGTNGSVNTTIGDGALNADNSYRIKITVADSVDSSYEYEDVFGTAYTLDLLAGGKGVSFGKPAEMEDTVDIAFKTHLRGGLDYVVLEPETDLNTVLTPNFYIGANLTNYDYTNTPSEVTKGTFMLLVYSCGEEGQIQQIITTCSKTKPKTYWRFYYQDTWGDWYNNTGEEVLFETTTTNGEGGTVNLNKSCFQFTYLEIYYTDNSGDNISCHKVYNPSNGQKITLTHIEGDTYIRRTLYTIKGLTLTPDTSDSGRYMGYIKMDTAGSWSRGINKNYIRIHRVVGIR